MNYSTSENAISSLERGKALFDLAYYEPALAHFERVLEQQPENHNVWVLHAATLTHLNRYAAAIDSLENALKFCPSRIDENSGYDRQTISLFIAVVLRELNRDREANACLSRVLEVEATKKITFWEQLWQKPIERFEQIAKGAKKSERRAVPRRIGERLEAAGLIAAEQIELILAYQRQHPHLRFGDIAVMWGWLKPETFDFFVQQLSPLALTQPPQRLGYYLKSAALLDDFQIGTILEYQRSRRRLLFGEVAIRQGWLKRETIDFFVEHFHS